MGILMHNFCAKLFEGLAFVFEMVRLHRPLNLPSSILLTPA